MEEHRFQFLLSFSFQNLSKLSCQWTIFILSAAFELFHSRVKQSTALESQDVLGWRVSWCCFNSCGDIDLCPEGRAEARLNSITYYKIAFRQLFSFSVSAGIVQNYLIFFSHYYSSSPLKGSSSNTPCFYLFLQTKNSSCSTPPSLHHQLLYPAIKSKAKPRLLSTELANPNTTQQSRETHSEMQVSSKNFKTTHRGSLQVTAGPQRAHSDFSTMRCNEDGSTQQKSWHWAHNTSTCGWLSPSG